MDCNTKTDNIMLNCCCRLIIDYHYCIQGVCLPQIFLFLLVFWILLKMSTDLESQLHSLAAQNTTFLEFRHPFAQKQTDLFFQERKITSVFKVKSSFFCFAYNQNETSEINVRKLFQKAFLVLVS